jgi:hypothetical protein
VAALVSDDSARRRGGSAALRTSRRASPRRRGERLVQRAAARGFEDGRRRLEALDDEVDAEPERSITVPSRTPFPRAAQNAGPSRNVASWTATSARPTVPSPVEPAARSSRRVRTEMTLQMPTAMMVDSTMRHATWPSAPLWLWRLRTGYITTAVAMPEMASPISVNVTRA